MEESFDNYLDNRIRQHHGWQELERFGTDLGQRALTAREIRIFLASTACFFREIPTGILALALRVTDDRMDSSRFGAVDHGARILLAAVDEYGLADMREGYGLSHHQLFARMIESFGISEAELGNRDYIIPEADELAAVTRELYRSGSVAAGVGFHFASEKTSDREFQLCYESLSRYTHIYANGKAIAAPESFLGFYHVHTIVEPLHGSASAEAVNLYATQTKNRDHLLQGAERFMEAYGNFWAALHKAIAN
jgi:hypothetical protein